MFLIGNIWAVASLMLDGQRAVVAALIAIFSMVINFLENRAIHKLHKQEEEERAQAQEELQGYLQHLKDELLKNKK